MSRSYRFKHTKIRLIAGLSAALIFCGLCIGYGLQQSSEYERQANNKSREYASQTSEKISGACAPLPVVESIKCTNDARDAQREYEYKQSDLVAQRQSVLWAYIMASAAIIGMVLSAVGVWLVKTTFDATVRANEIAGNSARAWVSIKLSQFTAIGPYQTQGHGLVYGFDVIVDAQNHGPSPAHDVRFVAEIVMGEDEGGVCDDWRKRLDATRYSGGIALFAGQHETQSHRLTLSKEKIDSSYKSQNSTLIHPRVEGCISYRTQHTSGVRQTRFVAYLICGDRQIDTADPNWWQFVTISQLIHIETD